MTPKVEATKTGKGLRIIVQESSDERAKRRARRIARFTADSAGGKFTSGQLAVLRRYRANSSG
jgi:hypothetical protein